MEGPSRPRESRARSRERDPGRPPRADRERRPERPRDGAGERRGERSGAGPRGAGRDRDRDRDRATARDLRHDRAEPREPRAGEQRAGGRPRPGRTRDAPPRNPWDAAPPPRSAPWGPPEPPPAWKEGFGRRGPESELTSESYLPPYPGPGLEDVDYYQSEARGLLDCHKCRYLCTGRACCQMLEVLLNLLILGCSSVSYSSTGGYTGITSLGGIYYYQYGGAYSGFEGADGEKARQLDVQFYQLKLPTVIAAMAYSGALMAWGCLLLILGTLRVPWHCPLWLVLEGLLDALVAGAYVPAMYFFFQRLSAAYASAVCQEREALYQSKGYNGFTCALHAGDIGVVQIVEVILNGMVLMCIVASYFVLAGFSASFTSGGGFGNNYYSPFEGTELEQVRQLDQQYTVLRSPLIYGGVAVALGLGVLTMGVLLQGARSLSRMPRKWLLLEAAFSMLAAVGYCVGIGFYLHGALQINATDTCQARERLYARKGLTWMNCQLAGTDGAAATFACLLVLMYGASVVLALRSMREQKRLCKDSQSLPTSHGQAPEYLWSGVL